MNTDLNGKIQGKLNQNRKNRNTKKALLVLSLAAVIFTSTVLANPASALTEDVSGEVVQGLENGGNSGSGAQAPSQAAVEQACRGFSGCDGERHRGQRDSCVRRGS